MKLSQVNIKQPEKRILFSFVTSGGNGGPLLITSQYTFKLGVNYLLSGILKRTINEELKMRGF